jgi:hypothetical protein
MDAITLLKDDHKSIGKLFRQYEKLGPRAHAQKRKLVDQMIEELSRHAALEEQLFYPVIRATVPDTENQALEGLEEHHIVKWVLSELESLSPEDERFGAKVTVLIENVRHHHGEEETDLFPMVRDELGRNALQDLGEAMVEARKTAPTKPHPRSPDAPPGNVVAGAAASIADRAVDTVGGIAQGGVAALADVVDTVLRRKKPRRAPRGSTTTKRTARKVRSGVGAATDAAIDTVRQAQSAGERTLDRARDTGSSAASGARRTASSAASGGAATARAAKAGAKGTVTSAKRSGKRAATTAKRGATTTGRTARKAAEGTRATAQRSARATVSAS